MLDIIEKYNESKRQEDKHCDALEKKIIERKKQVTRLKKRLDKAPQTNWIDGIVKPLSEALSVYIGLPWEIYGPFGLSCETSIYLREDMSKSICDQKTYSITLVPAFAGDMHSVKYRTGEKTGEFMPGSLVAVHGFDCVTKYLPDTIEEITELLRETGEHKQ